MAAQTEYARPPSVVRVIALVGVSEKTWSDAAREAITRVSQTIRHITGADSVHSTTVVRDGRIAEYHVNVNLFRGQPDELVDQTFPGQRS